MGLTGRGRDAWPLLSSALAAAVTTSPWWHRRRRPPRNLDAAAQALAPWAGLSALPLALHAARRRRPVSAALAGTATALGAVVWGWTNGRPRRSPIATGPQLRIAHFNLWYDNRDPAAMAATIAAVAADVVTFCELTPELLAHLRAAGAHEPYPHRVERAAAFAAGAAIWSNRPLAEVAVPAQGPRRTTVEVELAGAPLRVDAVHPLSPIGHARQWHRDLARLAAEPVPTDRAAVLIGDFNSGWPHPGFRAIVGRGWREAHRELGRGRVNSWRTDVRGLPPFVRLDHALVNGHLDVVAVEDVSVPGSDHRGLVVTVTPAR